MSSKLHLVTYLSKICKVQNPNGLELSDRILEKSRPYNQSVGISGVLVMCDGSFLQVLEGPEEHVRSLFAKIEKDPRHTDVRVLVDRPIEHRQFGDWAMACADLASDGMALKSAFIRLETTSSMDLARDFEFISEYITLLQRHIQSQEGRVESDRQIQDRIHILYDKACRYAHIIKQLSLLTQREREVMRWVVAGNTNREIADELNIAETTIKIHRGRVMRKLGLKSLPELVRAHDRLALISML